MSYLVPSEFVAKMVDAGESKIYMSTRDTLIRADDGVYVLVRDSAVREPRRKGDALQEPVDGTGRILDISERIADAPHVLGDGAGVEADGVSEDHSVGQAMGDAGSPADQLGQTVMHAHARVLQCPPSEDGAGEHLRARQEIDGIVDDRRQ